MSEINKKGLKKNIKDIAEKSDLLIENMQPHVHPSQTEGIIYLPIAAGLKKYPQYRKKYWQLVAKDRNEITAAVAAGEMENGIFILAPKGTKNTVPLRTCFLINQNELEQKIHNLFIVEDDAELHIVTGCTVSSGTKRNKHLAVTEMYVGKGATLSYTMIHDWNPDTEVYPVTVIKQEKDSVFISNYVTFEAVKMMKSYPTAYIGENAIAHFNSMIFAPEGANYNVGSRGILEGENSKVEIISRNVSAGGTIIMPAHIKSTAKATKGHIECSALMLKDKCKLHAVPELESDSMDAELTHEAAIGKISQDELNYLMARGISEEEAKQIIIRGFLSLDIKGLPDHVKQQIEKALEMLSKASL
ncbi:MAG: SufD family Fe-S cluster assembly protein [Candidatus Margulisbacteria bacterium]|nr:SufD family Fe-S cluster assembly protein [Candidatus Margulisiibacteriota bacterium]